MKSIIATLLILLPLILLGGEVKSDHSESENAHPIPSLGSILILQDDFDVYRSRIGSRKKPTYHYLILPVPETGIGGPELDYLGRIPSGTKLKIIEIKKERWAEGVNYWVNILPSINRPLLQNPKRESVKIEENIYSKKIKIRRTASKTGTYAKGKYSNGNPRLNEIWIKVSRENEPNE